MREILFRGKRKDNGEWVYGYLYITHTGDYEIGYYSKELDIERTTYLVIQETVGQYTGRHDKNGAKIFEGDIVKVYDKLIPDEKPYHEFIGCIVFSNGCFAIEDDSYTHYRWLDYDVEVVGNIHDNPELLEVDGRKIL